MRRKRIARLLRAGAGVLWACALLTVSTASAEVRVRPVDHPNPSIVALHQLLTDRLTDPDFATEGLDIRVTIGFTELERALAENDSGPLLATFVTTSEFASALGVRARPSNITAVYSNPDPMLQFGLAQQLLGDSTVGVFDSPAVHQLAQRLETGVESAGALQVIPAAAGQSIDSLLRDVATLDALVVLPDSAVLNRSNINHVVRTLYRQRKVLIGYSDTLTRVGSLASVYPRPAGVVDQVANMLIEYRETEVLPAPAFVNDVDISVNERLARSLNISIPDKQVLLDGVRSNMGVVP